MLRIATTGNQMIARLISEGIRFKEPIDSDYCAKMHWIFTEKYNRKQVGDTNIY